MNNPILQAYLRRSDVDPESPTSGKKKPKHPPITTIDQLYALCELVALNTVCPSAANGLYTERLQALGMEAEDVGSAMFEYYVTLDPKSHENDTSVTYTLKLKSKGRNKAETARMKKAGFRPRMPLPISWNNAYKAIRDDLWNMLEERAEDPRFKSIDAPLNTHAEPDPYGCDDEDTFGDELKSHRLNVEENQIDLERPLRKYTADQLLAALESLDNRQQRVIRFLHLTDREPTYREAELALGMSKSTIYRVEQEAVARIFEIIVGQNSLSMENSTEGENAAA